MPQDEPTEAIIRREIAAARRILREDRVIKSHSEMRERFDKQFPPDPVAPEGTPQPPKPGDPKPPKPEGGRKSLWWGDATE